MAAVPGEAVVSEETKQRVAAAKQYIENMYKVQHQNIQERYARRFALEAELRREGMPEEDQKKIMGELEKRESDYIRLQRQRLSADDFEPLTIIGRGAFGEVRIVKEKLSGKIMAMKKLKKAEMLRRGQVEHVKAERNVLAEVHNPYIVKLYYSFQDEEFLYLVMEYLPGGDVMTLLMRKDILSEEEARFYCAQTVLAIESIHQHNYIHREGEEFTDANGLQPTATASTRTQAEQLEHWQRNRRQLAFSTVGTPDYIAPEAGDPGGGGEPVGQEGIRLGIQGVEVDMADVLQGMEQPAGAKEIKAHPFFAGVNWAALHTQTPPYVPRVEHELDTQNFERFDEDMTMSTPGAVPRKWNVADPHFIGYTYKNWEAVHS
eukprot:gene1879-2214_t